MYLSDNKFWLNHFTFIEVIDIYLDKLDPMIKSSQLLGEKELVTILGSIILLLKKSLTYHSFRPGGILLRLKGLYFDQRF